MLGILILRIWKVLKRKVGAYLQILKPKGLTWGIYKKLFKISSHSIIKSNTVCHVVLSAITTKFFKVSKAILVFLIFWGCS